MVGAKIPVEMKLIPILKGLTLGRVKLDFKEKVEYRFTNGRTHVNMTTVKHKEEPIPAGCLVTPEDRLANGEENVPENDMYKYTAHLELPNRLTSYHPDMENKHFKIEHELWIFVQLHNPDGHISEVSLVLLRTRTWINLFAASVKIPDQDCYPTYIYHRRGWVRHSNT